MEIVYHVACSLDGYIADREGGVDWLNAIDDRGEDYGFAEFVRGLDGIVMGSRTYEFVLDHDEWVYPDTPSWVFTSRDLALAASFACRRLISELKVAVVPVLLGGGTRLLEGELAATELELLGETKYANGIVHLEYRSMPHGD